MYMKFHRQLGRFSARMFLPLYDLHHINCVLEVGTTTRSLKSLNMRRDHDEKESPSVAYRYFHTARRRETGACRTFLLDKQKKNSMV
jgi:hypothetical protein